MNHTIMIPMISVALIVSGLFLFFLSSVISNRIEITPIKYHEENFNGYLKDNKGDTKLIALHKTNVIPEINDYHDILSIGINKVNDNKILFTIELAGNANKNENYETVYVWFISYYTTNTATVNTASTVENKFHLYTIIIPNFGSSNFENKKEWYLAIFNNTDNSYTLPLSRITDMPTNKVQFFIDPILIGNPSSPFNYSASSMIRVNNTFLEKPPDYIIDYVPNNLNSFWEQWFSD